MSLIGARPVISSRTVLLLAFAAAFLLALALSAPAAHAQDAGPASSTLFTTVIEYQSASGYNFDNVNVTWTNTNDCGSFSGDGAGATWNWGAGVGAIPCTGSAPPTGTITQTASSDGTVLATCTDTQGAATYGYDRIVSGTIPSECTNTGAGVSITLFFAQAYNASGQTISAGSSGNDDWIIAVVVAIILVLLLLFFYVRRKRKASPEAAGAQGLAGEAESEAKKLATGAEKEAKVAVDKVKSALNRGTTQAAAGAQASSTSPGVPPASAARFCTGCGSPVDPGAAFCPKCGKAL
ncbi:MAG: zinc ribbon domain-containing protein [Nitrososphaerales archaeon]